MSFLDYTGLKLFKETLTNNFCANTITSASTITKGDGFDVKGAKVLYDGWLLGDSGEDLGTKAIWLGGNLKNKDIRSYSCLEFVYYEGSYEKLSQEKGRPLSYRWYDPEPGLSVFLRSMSWGESSASSSNQLFLKSAELAFSPIATADDSPALLILHPAYEMHSDQPTSGTSVTWQTSSGTGQKWSIALKKVIAWA